jgi:hypothetical protein
MEVHVHYSPSVCREVWKCLPDSWLRVTMHPRRGATCYLSILSDKYELQGCNEV